MKFYITTPIYYASGKPHIGHAFATLYADVIARYKKLHGNTVFFATGMDEHGSKIAESAEKEGKQPQEFVDSIAEDYIKVWEALGIEYADFVRTTSESHKNSVYKFIEKLKESGDIYEGIYEGLYCVGCEKFLTEKDLVNGVCPDHLKPPVKISEKNYFFNLKKYLPIVKEKILSRELNITPESRKNEILSIIDSGIPDFSITREKVKWGISYPYEENQVIYVWVEALMNYISILGFPDGENFNKFWPADVHIIGAEINKFHSIFWPALLLSANLALPKNIFVHGLFTINGQKMSKTLGNIIDPLNLIDKFDVDGTRYLLLSQFSALEHGDIKEEEFTSKYNSDLANGIGNLLERVLTMIINFRAGVLSEEVDEKIKSLAEQAEKDYNENIENFRLFDALKIIFSFIKNLDEYINEKQPWVLNKNQDPELDKVLNSLFFGINNILNWLEPFLPSKVKEAKDYISNIKSGDKKSLGLFPRLN